MDRRSGGSAMPVAMYLGERAHRKLSVRAGERYDVCAAERPEGSKIAWPRPMVEQDVDLSAVSAVVDVLVSSADNQQCRSNGWQRTLAYGPLNFEPSRFRSAALGYQTGKSAECRAVQSNRRSRQCVGLESAMICSPGALEGMATNGAWPAAVSYPARTIFLYHC